jgi:Winged helix DNA-binding domain
MPPLALTREQILAFRRGVGALDARLAPGPDSLRRAAWAGLQDSMPRAAVLSLHARVEGVRPESWEDPVFVQLWGPRYQVYVVAADDLAVFSLGRLPEDARGRQRAEHAAARMQALLRGRQMSYDEAGGELAVHPGSLRYGATTGTMVIRWAGARAPTVRMVPRPDVDPFAAQLELARRYLHVYGPAAPAAFTKWAGISARAGAAAFAALAAELVEVHTPIGPGWTLAGDEAGFRAHPGPPAPARLLPSGDAYYLLQGADRELLVPDAVRRPLLWTPRVWPGAVLVEGEIRGTWRRANEIVRVEPWGTWARGWREAVEAEAAGLPLPGLEGRIVVRWGR